MVTANLTMTGFNLSVVPDQVPLLRGSAARLIELWRTGAIRPIVGARFDFDRLPDAHRHLASRQSTGRVVVDVAPGDARTHRDPPTPRSA
jgi:NADPH:quinone reductase-like Zn-dependent oxidoreductase